MRTFQFLVVAMALTLCACGRQTPSGATDITGAMPVLSFSMTRANDRAAVSENDYRGKAVALYFGYTHCPDECPTTLANLAAVLKALGPRADDMRVLFVSVDPDRDSLPILKAYVSTFAPQIDGLRGTPDQITRLARRYRVVYRVTSTSPGHAYEVMHSNTVYIFDPSGHARLVTMRTDGTSALALDFAGLMTGPRILVCPGLHCSSQVIMPANAVIRARIDQRLKDEASAVLGAVGLTVSDAVRLMLVRTVAEKALPFDPLVPNRRPSRPSRQRVAATRRRSAI